MRPARIVLTTWGSLGDLYPYLALAVELSRRGHAAVVATLPGFQPFVEAAGVEFRPLRPDVSPDDPRVRELVRLVLDARRGPEYLFTEVLGPVMRETYDDTLAAVTGNGGADLLVSHQIPLTGPIVAAQTGVRWVSAVLAPGGLMSATDPMTPPQAPALRRILALHPAIARAFLALARGMLDRWAEPVYRLRRDLGLPRGENPILQGQHSPRRVLALFSTLFGRIQPDYPARTLITGFPFYDATPPGTTIDPALERFLDAGDPPIVFTLGSSAVWIAEDFYPVSIEAVQRIGRRAVLLAGENAAALRPTLPPTIAAFEYAPHALVMPRASVIVHQGGIGTTAQALRAGRPMLVVPFGQDQPDNARRSVELGVARTIGRRAYRVDRVAGELAALRSDGEHARRASAVGAGIRAERGVETACDAIEAALA
jgi:rhamnosyltransferase subunit B